MIGIINAMHCEMEPLLEQLTVQNTETISDTEFVIGTLAGHEVVIAECGIGKVFAAMCAQTMILRYHPDKIIMTGVAGSLTNKLSIGGIALGMGAVQHDIDTTAIGDDYGTISGANETYVVMPTDKKTTNDLLKIAKQRGYETQLGIIASGDQFVADSARKEFIIEKFRAIACEMEGGAVAQVCYCNKVPFALIRAISDGADEEGGMDYLEFLPIAIERSSKLLLSYLKSLR